MGRIVYVLQTLDKLMRITLYGQPTRHKIVFRPIGYIVILKSQNVYAAMGSVWAIIYIQILTKALTIVCNYVTTIYIYI